MPPFLSDGVVTLRPPDERDLGAIEVTIRDPDIVRWIGPTEGTASDVLAANRRRAAEGSPTFAICEIDDVCVGHVWVNRDAGDATIGYVGYWLLPSARGRGLATRAVQLVSRWAVAELGIARLRLVAEVENDRSRRVAERTGFRLIERRPAHTSTDGRIIRDVVYELPRDTT